MPMTIPNLSPTAAAVERLPWSKMARFLVLLAWVRWLNRRLHAAHQRVHRQGLDAGGADLVLIVGRWLAAHQAISVLLGCPEPPHVAQVRARLGSCQEVKNDD
ncbi:hypothetical protein [Methylobacterium sp. GXF4]|uniref:hypothetical protein n=1 Tax=Methylobacterium sp. GXF4 TaxID=1096546 RepID=UPI000FFEF935|nr:hypothetical protein [Methylobacterium sp. GXF4]